MTPARAHGLYSAGRAKKLLNRDFANLVKRVQAGGKISRTERAILQAMAAGDRAKGPGCEAPWSRAERLRQTLRR